MFMTERELSDSLFQYSLIDRETEPRAIKAMFSESQNVTCETKRSHYVANPGILKNYIMKYIINLQCRKIRKYKLLKR